MVSCDITCENDVDFFRGFTHQTVDAPVVPIDLTSNTMRMGIRHRAADVAEELLLTTENGGITINDPANGVFTILITHDQLLRLPLGDYEHSLIRITASGLRLPVWSGTLTNNPGASR